MNFSITKFASCCLLAGAMWSCSDEPGDNGAHEFTAVPLTAETRGGVEINNGFATELFGATLLQDDSGDNICISPFSLFSTLSMMANGDDAASRDEILLTLGLTKSRMTLDDLNSYNHMLLSWMPRLDSKVECEFINAMWHDPSEAVNPDFADTLTSLYNAQLIAQSPAGFEGMSAINRWVSDRTHGMITKFLDDPVAGSVSLFNIVNFNGKWKIPFNKSETKDRKFHSADGTTSETPFMHVNDKFKYAECESFEAVKLYYGHRNFSMTAVLPKEGAEFKDVLNDEGFNDINRVFNDPQTSVTAQADICFPKYDVLTRAEMYPCLAAMGIKETAKAGLKSIIDTPVTINSITHAVRIIVNEEGTKASAASMAGDRTSFLPDKTVKISFDRPFIYIIQEESTGTILFMGAINKL